MNVFAVSPNWIAPVIEKIGYVTDVIRAYDDTEQRIILRETANGGIQFQADGMDAREAAQAEAFLWSHQADVIHVPWWQDAQPLLQSVNAGATHVSVDTDDRDFVVDKLAIIWRDQHTWEVLDIFGIDSDGLDLATGLDRAYTAGALIAPLKPCRLPNQQRLRRASRDVSEMEVAFTTETDETPEYTGATPTQYEGFDVLDETTPNNTADADNELARSMVLLDSKTSIRAADDHSGLATTQRGFNWFAHGRSEIAALKRFLHRRKGRAVPFWVPTYRNDLPLSEAAAGGASTFDIQFIGYTVDMFPDISRRRIAFVTPGGALTLRKVTGSVDNADGTETLTISAALPAGGFPVSTMVSFLALTRLADDDVDLVWSSKVLAEAEFETVEIPQEVPA